MHHRTNWFARGIAVLCLLSATSALSAAVRSEARPANLTYSPNPAVYTKGSPIVANAPSSTGGPVQSYSISGELPAGLHFDSQTGVLSGTPTEIQRARGYRIVAKNSSSKTATRLRITVNDVAPSQLHYAKNPAIYKKGVAIEANIPSAGGGAITKFALSGALPSGLRFDKNTGIITGTPKKVAAPFVYEVTASNSGGTTKAQLSITVSDIDPPAITVGLNKSISS